MALRNMFVRARVWAIRPIFVLGAALQIAQAPAWGETVTLTPVKDNSIFSSNEANSNALGDLFSGTTGGGNAQRCLLAFDVAGQVPAGSVITAASLTLALVQGSPDSGSHFQASSMAAPTVWAVPREICLVMGGAPTWGSSSLNHSHSSTGSSLLMK